MVTGRLGPRGRAHLALHRSRRHVCPVLLCIALLTSSASGTSAQGARVPTTLVLSGCGSNVAITRVLADAFEYRRPGVRIHIDTIGSTNGFWMALTGEAHLGLMSRPLREDEEAMGLESIAYARTPLVIVTHALNPIERIMPAELRDVYSGVRTRWTGGEDIVLLTREQGDSAVEELRRQVPGFADAYAAGERTDRWTILYSEGTMHRAVLSTPFAIGLSDLGSLRLERSPLKALKLGTAAPTLEGVATGQYPLVRTLRFAFWKHAVHPEASAFMDFVASEEGARILTANGYLPSR
jgi:phosphate transport system substrate-binding protein